MNELLAPELEYEIRDGEGGACVTRAAGARIDMHCHSSFSVERIRYLGGFEYYPLLEPEESYDLAKRRGMDFVTLTDHDTIDGCKALIDRRGELDDFIFGEEVSVRFPQDGTLIHINVYDIDEAQHRQLQRLRDDIYDVVDYCRAIDKLYVLNHMTWNAQHRKLKRFHIETMLELFDVFEGLNGSRSYAHNAFAWYATRGHGKALIAGSDSHTNRVGVTYTRTHGTARDELLANIRAGRTCMCGGFGTPEKLTEDIRIIIQKTFERRMLEASGVWERATCRFLRRLGAVVSPLMCVSYHRGQKSLVREFARAMPG